MMQTANLAEGNDVACGGSPWPNGKSPRAVGTNFSGLLADRAD
jgi:hypothetical protein